MFDKILKIIFVIGCIVMFVCLINVFVQVVQSVDIPFKENIDILSYNPTINYQAKMHECASDGSDYAMTVGYIYEQLRNKKLDDMNMTNKKTAYFETCETGEEILISMHADKLQEEYYSAGIVYGYLSKIGFSDPVIAGVLGNMMNECGGNTLALKPMIYGGGVQYYGVCMWDLRYASGLGSTSLETQLGYLINTMKKNINMFGGDYEYFISLNDPEQVARYFNKYYERGANANKRAQNAKIAYEWITKDW